MRVKQKQVVFTVFLAAVQVVSLGSGFHADESGAAGASSSPTELPIVIKGSSTSQIACRDETPTGTRVEKRRCQTVTAWRAEEDLTNVLRNIEYVSSRRNFRSATFSPSVLFDGSGPIGCRESLRSDDFDETIRLAGAALRQPQSDDNPDQRFDDLVCRASAYESTAKFLAAERDYRDALNLAARHFDPFEKRLLEPLSRLGRLRLAADDTDDAELFLLRAQDITHRNAGIYNVKQKELADDLSRVYLKQGRLFQANRQQELRLKSARETYGSSPELVGALHDYARWNAALQRFVDVGEAFDEAISILENAYGKNDLRLIETHQLRAKLYTLHPTISTPQAGKESMEKIAEIYAAQDYVDQVDLLEARTAVGDWYLQSLRKRTALNHYSDTVQKALAQRLDPGMIDSVYGVPKLFFLDTNKAFFFSPPGADASNETGIIRVRFSITSKGLPTRPKVVEDTVNNAAARSEVLKRVRTSVFRPRYVNGKAAETSRVEQEFLITRSGDSLTIGKFYSPVITAF
ncbi:MAG: hypothetical protein AB8G18_01045 [Gammaproteobacteria bacterium]